MAALAARLCSMSREELSWRLRTQIRNHAECAAAAVRTPRWRRDDVGRALAVDTLPEDVQRLVAVQDWSGVHHALFRRLRARPSRFALNHVASEEVRRNISLRWPEAASDASRRSEAIAAGTFDLLGFRGLSFGTTGQDQVDWHFDPVHQRRMPMAFWSRVPYLDPSCGDHKIIWELNRHQHWLTLTRALWLTGDQAHARQVVRDLTAWLEANPPLTGGNWASMLELAFRSLSWVWGLHGLLAFDEPAGGEEPWLVDLVVALDRQLTHVERNLSLYFSPNTHLTGEALALYVVGTALPELSSSTRWIDTGRRVLLDEIDRQIERDGGHVERSTHYHRYTLDFVLLALQTARRSGDLEAEERFAGAVERLVPFALAMADGSGRLPRIGDDDAGALWPIAGRDSADIRDSMALAAALLDRPEWAPWGATEEVLWLASADRAAFQRALTMRVDDRRVRERRTLPFRAAARPVEHHDTGRLLEFGGADCRRQAVERRGRVNEQQTADGPDRTSRRATRAFPDTGYVTTATDSGDHMVLDAGPHGYLNGGHAHADALSVVLALRGRPLLVDPGTPTYTMNPTLRDHLRSSSSHNTVTIDGASSAVPNGPFHWHTRADAVLETLRANQRFAFIEARHDAYRDVSHRRIVIATDGGYLFLDQLDGHGLHQAAQHWHFDPRWHVTCESGQALRLIHDNGQVAWLLYERGALGLVNGDDHSPFGWVSPAYGVRVPSWTARVTHTDSVPFGLATWCGVSEDAEIPMLERITCDVDAGAAATAIRVCHSGREWVTLVRPGDVPVRSSRASVMAAIETDARALQYSSRHGELASLSLADGTYARSVDIGVLSVEADSRLDDLHVQRVEDRLELFATAPASELRLHGHLLDGVTRLVLNGREQFALPAGRRPVVLMAADWTASPAATPFQDHHDVRYRRLR